MKEVVLVVNILSVFIDFSWVKKDKIYKIGNLNKFCVFVLYYRINVLFDFECEIVK